jgi:small-conductance mechanosensitive channel
MFTAQPTSSWQSLLPPALHVRTAGLEIWQWVGVIVVAGLAYTLGRVLAFVAVRAATRITQRTAWTWDDEALDALGPPSQLFFSLLAFEPLIALLALPDAAAGLFSHLVSTVLIGAVGWTAVRLVGAISHYVEHRLESGDPHDKTAQLDARGLRTHVRVLGRVASAVIAMVAGSLMLTQFEVVRSMGVSLLASAGLAGIVLGFAAQRTLGSLIAGIQLTATQPIRIGDVVIVEKESGTIEEITLTYVVVKIWDERRLIIPVSRFLEQPFENWTKVSAELHGSVILHVDWTLPVDEFRHAAYAMIDGHPLWDGRTKSVQVVDAKEQTIAVRVLVSAKDASDMWTIRVDLREKLITWLQGYEGGRFLPRLRVEEDGPRRP